MTNSAKFGLAGPIDMFEKLKREAEVLLRQREETEEEQRLEEFEAFNFFVTAWHLHKDWLHGSSPDKPRHALAKINAATPSLTEVKQAIRDIANGSKHFELDDQPKVTVGEREVSCWFSYFNGPQFSIDTKSFHFLLYELVDLVMNYFHWIFDDSQPVIIPAQIIDKLAAAKELRTARKACANVAVR